MTLTDRAFAKLNLNLYLGPTRPEEGRHELVSVMEPLELADTLTLERAAAGTRDEVVCPGVEGPNLAARALEAFREATGWDGPPVRITIDKRIPVAAGMAGGSADAAAALRLAARASGLGDDEVLLAIAARLGSDVPAQVRPGRVLVTGTGEGLERMAAPPRPYGVLVVASETRLSTGAVYAECDRLGLPRDAAGLAEALARVRRAGDDPPIGNEMQPAALSLCPSIAGALDAVARHGADHALVSGSGPTVVGLFPDPGAAARAARALEAEGRPGPRPIVTRPLTAAP